MPYIDKGRYQLGVEMLKGHGMNLLFKTTLIHIKHNFEMLHLIVHLTVFQILDHWETLVLGNSCSKPADASIVFKDKN